jgi:hypothetical protein
MLLDKEKYDKKKINGLQNIVANFKGDRSCKLMPMVSQD